MLAGGRSPWPLAAIVAAALLGRVMLGASAPSAPRRGAFVFWAGFALGAAVFYSLLNDEYVRMVRVHTRFVPVSLRPVSEWLLGHGAAFLGVVAGAGFLEAALRPLRDAVGERMARSTRGLARRAGPALAVLVLVSLAASLFIDYPQLVREPPRPLTAPERVTAVLGSMATMFRLSQPDFLLASSFWVGFGWLDTMPKPPFQAFVVALVALAAAALFVHVGQHQQARRFLWLLILGVGSVASLVLYTLTTQGLPMALGGRYLVGWYVCVLGVIGTALTLDHSAPQRERPESAGPSGTGRAALLLVVAGSIHVYCLCFVLQRYF
jgi:hypothetical protein